MDADLSLQNTAMRPDTEIILFHYQNLNSKIGSVKKKSSNLVSDLIQSREWCCTQELYDANMCSDRSALFIKGVSNWTRVDDKYLIDESSTIYYWNGYNGYPYDDNTFQTSFSQKITFSKTGIWYLLIAQCNDTHSLYIDGVVEWHNPFGYLSGTLFPFLPMYVTISIAIFILLLVWVVYLIKYRQNLMGLQHVITAVIAVAFVENVLWSYDYINCNITGLISDAVNLIGALLTASKLTLIRTNILLVALGYSITVPSLDKRTKVYVISLTIIYGVSCAAQQYIWEIRTLGFVFPRLLEFVVWLVVLVSNICFISWVAFSLFSQWKTLSNAKQTEKLSMYKTLCGFLFIFLFTSIILFFIQTGLTALNRRDEFWRIWWIWDGYWEIGYFLVILIISVLWWPNEKNERYAYSMQLPGDEELDNVDEFPTDTPMVGKQKKKEEDDTLNKIDEGNTKLDESSD
eukprot:TRINITY_DN456_c0_g1_i1.p1 TRINITY_DN456_c0_g1~~TRINITY_DN456_c0_g1_i1.p1  ORF type:complete len:509 (+),score=54.41 TRINITY_DN456_c0_g1_i1:150-1529(+)